MDHYPFESLSGLKITEGGHGDRCIGFHGFRNKIGEFVNQKLNILCRPVQALAQLVYYILMICHWKLMYAGNTPE